LFAVRRHRSSVVEVSLQPRVPRGH
jgi:hypothetical protein